METKKKRSAAYYVGLLAFTGFFIFLKFVIVPNVEEPYVESDVEALKVNSFYVILGFILVLFALLLTKTLIQMKDWAARIILLLAIGFYIFLTYNIFRDTYSSIYLAINKSESKKTELRIYRVVHKFAYSNKKGEFSLIRLSKNKEVVNMLSLPMSRDQYQSIAEGSTLAVKFKIGKLGLPYDPKILPTLSSQ